MDFISYHGTNEENAQLIVGPPSGLKIDLGSGELGKGFYTGDSIAVAAIWAQARYKEKGVVVEFTMPIQKFVQLKGCLIKTQNEVSTIWSSLKKEGTTRSHTFGYDYVYAPFATIENTGNQYKFESERAEDELNLSSKTIFPCVS